MARSLLRSVLLGLSLFGLLGCATGYHGSGLTGGYEETQLSEDTYQIRVQGNAYTRDSRVSQFLLRRAAELTLEHKQRWFLLRDSDQGSRAGSGGVWGVVSFPSGVAIVRILEERTEEAFDAVLVVGETSDVAGGRLSAEARQEYLRHTLADAEESKEQAQKP